MARNRSPRRKAKTTQRTMANNRTNLAVAVVSPPPPAVVVLPTSTTQLPHSNANTEQSVVDMQKALQVETSRQVYDSITSEWDGYCGYEWGQKRLCEHPTIMNADKVYKFVHYQVFREAKKPGGKKKRGGTSRFDKNDYKLVQRLYGRKWILGTGFIGLVDPAL
jgi:hypothetical protein